MMGLPAVILAGGRATRLGGIDKTLLDLGGTTPLALILDRLRGCGPIAISANGDPFRFAAFGLPVLPDEMPGQGPLSGILAAIVWAERSGSHAVLTVAGDTPFVPRNLVKRLQPPPAYAASLGRAHPLIATWPVTARDLIADHLARSGSRRVGEVTSRLAMRAIAFAATGFDPFLNLNTPDDVAAARAIYARSMTRIA